MMGRLGGVFGVLLPSLVLAQAQQPPQQWAPAAPAQVVPAQYAPQPVPAQAVQYAPPAPAQPQYAPAAQAQPQYAPAPQQVAPAPQAPPQYAPAPQQYAPAPQQYAPAPQQYAPAPQQYAPAAQGAPQYAPAPQQYAPAAQGGPQYAPPPQQYPPPAPQYAPAPQQGSPAGQAPPQYAPAQGVPAAGAAAAGAAAGAAAAAPYAAPAPPAGAPPRSSGPAAGAGAAGAPPAAQGPAAAPAQLPADAPVKTVIPPGGVPAPQTRGPAPSAEGPGKTVDSPLPPPGIAREVYNRDSLRLRAYDNEVYTERGARQLSAAEFYRLAGRPDLASASEVRKGERGLLYTLSFLTFAAGVASGVYMMTTAQNPNAASCFTNGTISYNQCIQSNSHTKTTGAALIGAGLVVGGLLLTWAALTPDMVTSPKETAQLVDQYNRNLSKRLTSALSEPRVQVTPMFGKDGGGLAARFTF